MKTILVPTDFSACSAAAVKYAIVFANKTDKKLLFIHSTFLLIPTSSTNMTYMMAVKSNIATKMKALKKFIDDTYAELGLKRNLSTTKLVVKFGTSVVDNIQEIIDEQFIDLIILGTHGASGFKKFLFGSNATAIIQNINTPVLAIPHKYKYNGISNIAYAASDLINLKKEIKKIVSVARMLDASLNIFHIDKEKSNQKKTEAETLTNKLRQHFEFYNINITIIEDWDKDILTAIKDYTKRKPVDILVMQHQKKNLLERLFMGSQTKEMAYDLKVPLLAMQ